MSYAAFVKTYLHGKERYHIPGLLGNTGFTVLYEKAHDPMLKISYNLFKINHILKADI